MNNKAMLKIYFAEDDASIRKSIIRNIKWERLGYELAGEAGDGETAWEELRTHRCDVLLTDLRMPFMDGLELSRLVRKEMPDVKVIILTGYNDFESVQEALNIGVHKYLLKPVTPTALAQAITDMRDTILQERGREVAFSPVDNVRIDRVAVRGFLRGGTAAGARALLDELFAEIGRDKLESFILRQYIAMDFKFIIVEFLEDIGVAKEAILAGFEEVGAVAGEAVAKLASVADTREYLARLLEYAARLRSANAGKRYDGSIEKAKEYIEENFADEAISLNAVAKLVNLSPAHFSTVFSQEAGKTFTEYLTAVRLERAKELLACSSKRSSEIASEVGYQDPRYFSFVFKKATGLSPREFRASIESKVSE